MSLKVSLRCSGKSKEKRETYSLKAGSPRAGSREHLCGLRDVLCDASLKGCLRDTLCGCDTLEPFAQPLICSVSLGVSSPLLCLGFLICKRGNLIPVLPLNIWKGTIWESGVESTIWEKILTMDQPAYTCAPKAGAGTSLPEVCFPLLDHGRYVTTETLVLLFSPGPVFSAPSCSLAVLVLALVLPGPLFLFISTCCLLIIQISA